MDARLALAAAAALVLSLAAAASLDGRAVAAAPGLKAGGEFSAAKRKKTATIRAARPDRVWRAGSRFSPGDPSYGIEELERRRAQGECVIDLGYGRFESCHVGGAM